MVGLREVDHLGKADLGVDILQKDLEEEGQVVDHHQKGQVEDLVVDLHQKDLEGQVVDHHQKGQVEDLVVDLHQKDLEEEGRVVDHHQKDQGLEGKEEGKERGKEDEEFELSLLYMK